MNTLDSMLERNKDLEILEIPGDPWRSRTDEITPDYEERLGEPGDRKLIDGLANRTPAYIAYLR
jgi:hypothetical protein